MKKKMIQKVAHHAAQTALQSVRPVNHGSGNTWKCVSFLLIGLIGGYLLSPAKGGVLIGSFNACRGGLPDKREPVLPHVPHGRRVKAKGKPFAGSVVVGSFNGFRVDEEKTAEDEY